MSDAPVILGGGPAGASAAIRLARAGLSPLVIERDAGPRHKVCGEFLSIEAQAVLAHLGLDLDALGASRMTRVRLVHGRRVAESALPFMARGLTRRTMDEALLAAAASAGARIERGVAVRSVGDRRLTLDGGREIAAPRLLLASGKHDVRGARRDPAGTMADLVGFKAYWRLPPAETAALDGHIEIVLFDGGYAGLQLVEDGIANLCLLATQARLAAAGGWEGLRDGLVAECPHLARRLGDGEELLDRALAISNVPYGYLHRPRAEDPDWIWRAGDQLAVIPSFSGDGMSIAMATGLAAADALIAGTGPAAHHAARAAELAPQLALADRLHRLSRIARLHGPAVAVARSVPSVLRAVARATRVPEAALPL